MALFLQIRIRSSIDPGARSVTWQRHYSYLKISKAAIINASSASYRFRRLASRPAHAVIREAEKLVDNGVKELPVISQDASAYGVDIRHAEDQGHRAHITDLARDLGTLGAWVRLHYVYPYPHVHELIPLMAEGLVLPYLDVPFQHGHPDVLRRMARPAASCHTGPYRRMALNLSGHDDPFDLHRQVSRRNRTEFKYLLDWLDEAQLDPWAVFSTKMSPAPLERFAGPCG